MTPTSKRLLSLVQWLEGRETSTVCNYRTDEPAVLSGCAVMRAARGKSLQQQGFEIVEFEGFVHHLGGTQVERALRDLRCAISRHQNHSAAWRQAPYGRQQGQVIGIRKSSITTSTASAEFVRARIAAASVVYLNHRMAGMTEGRSNRPPNEQLILDHEHAHTTRNSGHKEKPRTLL